MGTYVFKSSNGGRKEIEAETATEAREALAVMVRDPGDWRLVVWPAPRPA